MNKSLVLKNLLLVAVFFPSLTAWGDGPAAEFAKLLPFVPSDSNALILVHADSLCSSQFHKLAQATDPDSAEPFPGLKAISKAVVAAKWRLPECEPMAESMIVELKEISAPEIVQNFGKSPGLTRSLPHDSIPVVLTDKLLGIYSPADRQAAMRWATSGGKESTELLPAYLRQGVGYAENVGTQIVFSLDLTHALELARVQQWLGQQAFASPASVDKVAVAQVLANARGCTLGVRFTDAAVARWRFDFADSVEPLKAIGQPLALALVDHMGMRLDGMDSWTVSTDAQSLYLGGKLDAEAVRVLLSLLSNSPQLSPETQAISATRLTDSDSGSQKKAATKANFDALRKLLRDVTHPDHALITSGSKAMYLERYAEKIDRLPILNIDEELVELTAEIATRLRVQANRTRNNMISTSVYTNNPTNSNLNGGGYNYNVGGYYRMNVAQGYGLTEQQIARTYARATSAQSGADQKREIADAMAAMRRTLTLRYQVEF